MVNFKGLREYLSDWLLKRDRISFSLSVLISSNMFRRYIRVS